VVADEALVVIETDKVTVELPAPSAGVLTKTLKVKGDKAMVGEVIGYLEAGAAPKGDAGKSDGAK
jgi:2-oxoglutarate dehydrogenase E2 component (dihydrolipoamide succinyltransferase)